MCGWILTLVEFHSHRREKLLAAVQSTLETYKACKRMVADASAKFITERSKNARKQAAVDKYQDLLARSKLLEGRCERTLHEIERHAAEHRTVRDTTERRVEYEQGKLDEVGALLKGTCCTHRKSLINPDLD